MFTIMQTFEQKMKIPLKNAEVNFCTALNQFELHASLCQSLYLPPLETIRAKSGR